MLNPQVYLERRFHYLPMFSYTSPDETAFVRWRLADELRRAEFQEVSITPFDWLHPATPKPLVPLVRGIGAMIERIPLAREFSGSLHIRARRPKELNCRKAEIHCTHTSLNCAGTKGVVKGLNNKASSCSLLMPRPGPHWHRFLARSSGVVMG